MATPPKYQKGMKIDNLMDCIAYLMAGAVFYVESRFMGAKVLNSVFVKHWSFAYIQEQIDCGLLYLAEKRRNANG
jgi:phosphatidylserine synthase